MKMEVNEKAKIVAFWLTNSEQKDTVLQAEVRELCQKFRERKYLPAVFYSGEKDLCAQTSALLRYNRRRCAEQEVHSAKPQSTENFSSKQIGLAIRKTV